MVVAAAYFMQEVLRPIALAILFSFLLAPLMHQFEKRIRLPRVPAALLSVLLAFGLLAGIGYVVYDQIAELSSHWTEYRDNIQKKIDSMRGSGGIIAEVHKMSTEVRKVGDPGGKPATNPTASPPPNEPPAQRVAVTNFPTQQGDSSSPLWIIQMVFGKVLGPVGSAIIITVFTIFMLIQKEDLRDRVVRLVGRSRLTMTTQALDDAAARVSRYLVLQTVVNGSVGVAVFLLLWLVGKINGHPFPQPALWGLLTALLRFVPYVGIWASSLLPTAVSLAVFSSAKVSLESFGVYVVVEGTVANIIEPLLFGSSTGIATLAVLMAAAFWAWLWGPVGLLLSTPLTVCLVVLGKYVPQLAFFSILLGDEPALSPPARLYERLLALNSDEAADLAHEFAKDKPLEQTYDEMMLPALVMVEQDHDLGNLEAERYQSILAGLRGLVEELGDSKRAEAQKIQADKLVHAARGVDDVAVPALQYRLPDSAPAATTAVLPGGAFHLPIGCTVTVACLAAHDLADEVAAVMMQNLLQLRSYCVILGPAESLASELAIAIEKADPDVLCISSVPPTATVHARQLLKRLSLKVDDVPIVAGLWKTKLSAEQAKLRLGAGKQVQVARTLHEALEQIHQFAQPTVTRVMEVTTKV